jgi:hypothetical protein
VSVAETSHSSGCQLKHRTKSLGTPHPTGSGVIAATSARCGHGHTRAIRLSFSIEMHIEPVVVTAFSRLV